MGIRAHKDFALMPIDQEKKAVRFPVRLFVCVLMLSGAVAPCSHGGQNSAGDMVNAGDDGKQDAETGQSPDVPFIQTVVLSGDTVRDKIAGGWVGQMAGVARAWITEFQYKGVIIPEDEIPEWTPGTIITAFVQDDLYVEIPFMEAFLEEGPSAGWKTLGNAFAGTEFPLWHANEAARTNLRSGIPAPYSGHFSNNFHCDDIDWQIESDFVGIMSPGLPNEAAEMAWRVGHVMNFGDGVYGGVWVAAMQAEAFVAGDLMQVINAGLAVIPEGSIFRQALDDVISWHGKHPDDWESVWQLVEDKYGSMDKCPDFKDTPQNIDAKLNAAYVLIGLLYGEGDFEKTMVTATRCGQDSDCNPSTAAGILGTLNGLSGIPDEFKSGIDMEHEFVYTGRTLSECLEMQETLAREVVKLAGGSITGSGNEEKWTIPRRPVLPLIREQWPQTENKAPVINAGIKNVQGLEVTFELTATDDDGVAGIMWLFGDLARSDEAGPSHIYSLPGDYRAIVWVSDVTGNTNFAEVPVSLK
jgi:hypothetical protein